MTDRRHGSVATIVISWAATLCSNHFPHAMCERQQTFPVPLQTGLTLTSAHLAICVFRLCGFHIVAK